MFPAPSIQASAVMQQPGMSAEPVVARPTPPPPAPAAPVPGLRVMMDFSKASVMVGAQMTARLTLINESSVVASHVQVLQSTNIYRTPSSAWRKDHGEFRGSGDGISI
jgi:hypothetical protein